MRDQHPSIVFRKASQMGVSTYCILWVLWLCKKGMVPKGVIYWLPTGVLMKDFVETKVDTFVSQNPDVKLSTLSSQRYNIRTKFFFGIPTIWLGLDSKTGVKALSADASIFDEYDEAKPAQVAQARKRMSASDLKYTREMSVPIVPDWGIDQRFAETDQCHWAFRCHGCRSYNILEHYFPHCFKQIGDVYVKVCKTCKASLEGVQGEWIKTATAPERGYHISQLYSTYVSPTAIMKEYRETQFLQHFYSHVVGLPYLAGTDRVTVEQVLSLCNNERLMSSASQSSTAMGVDQGTKLHCVVVKPDEDMEKVLWVGELTEFEELDQVAARFSVRCTVIDGMPETRKAREFANRQHGRGWLCWYNDNQKGSFAWREDEQMVSVNRTESMDVGTQSLLKSKLSLPRRCPEVEEFARHCHNTCKVVEEDEETGSKRYVYKKLGPDHYRHALNYAQIAMEKVRTAGLAHAWR